VKILQDLTEGNSRLTQTNKAKNEKHICLGISSSKLKPIILTEMTEKHYLIILITCNKLEGEDVKTNAKTAFKS